MRRANEWVFVDKADGEHDTLKAAGWQFEVVDGAEVMLHVLAWRGRPAIEVRVATYAPGAWTGVQRAGSLAP